LLRHALGNPHAVGLLDLTALRDRYLPSPDFFASGRNADGVVPRLRLHHAGENGVVLGLLLGYGFGNADRIGLLDLTAFRNRNLSSSDFLTSRRNADGVVPRLRLHHASENRVVLRLLLRYRF